MFDDIDQRVKIVDDKVYAFSNENLTSFNGLYQFEGKDVVTVLGSGDQYFTCKLFGAKNVEVFDLNPNTWPFFVLKFHAIRTLSCDDFYDVFVGGNLYILNKVVPILPYDVLSWLQKHLRKSQSLDDILLYSTFEGHPKNRSTGRMIPYLDQDEYYRLQSILRSAKLPKFHLKNLLDLPNDLDRHFYDVLLTSNIYMWLSITTKEYDDFLGGVRAKTIQSYYSWFSREDTVDELFSLDHRVDAVPGHNPAYPDVKNYVISKINY